MSRNQLTRLGEGFVAQATTFVLPPSLRIFDVSHNRLATLPPELSKLAPGAALFVAGNERITSLDWSAQAISNLTDAVADLDNLQGLDVRCAAT